MHTTEFAGERTDNDVRSTPEGQQLIDALIEFVTANNGRRPPMLANDVTVEDSGPHGLRASAAFYAAGVGTIVSGTFVCGAVIVNEFVFALSQTTIMFSGDTARVFVPNVSRPGFSYSWFAVPASAGRQLSADLRRMNTH